MQLGVYSIEKVLYDGEAREVNLRTTTGEITILNNHEPMISVLEEGVIKIIDNDGKEHFVQVNSGFLEINAKDRVKILVDMDDAA